MSVIAIRSSLFD